MDGDRREGALDSGFSCLVEKHRRAGALAVFHFVSGKSALYP